MPSRKRQKTGKVVKGGERRKRRADDDSGQEDDGDDFFLAGEDRAGDAEDLAEGDEEVKESAEEKRLRLAKAYLRQLRASGAADSDDEGGGLVLGDDELAEKLRDQAQEAGGYLQRQLASRVRVSIGLGPDLGVHLSSATFHRCHSEAVTAVALTHDDAVVYSVGKDGAINRLDVTSGSRCAYVAHCSKSNEKGTNGCNPTAKHELSAHFRTTLSSPSRTADTGPAVLNGSGPDWVKKGPRRVNRKALLAATVSSDGQLLAVGGADRKVHIWDTRTSTCVQSQPGHKDAVSGLVFREETHELYSASFDRSIKLWSVDDRAYVDTLFGHQAEVLAIDALRQERVVSAGHDRTCRVWKVPEESQLIFRSQSTATDCCRYVTGTEWITGSNDGALALWSQLKKKPAFVVRNAHDATGGALQPEAGWVQSVATCRGSDLVASGAGDGLVRLWQISRGAGPIRSLQPLETFPAKGFVNALAVARSARFIVAGLGREQRLGRWATFKGGKTGLLLQQLTLAAEE